MTKIKRWAAINTAIGCVTTLLWISPLYILIVNSFKTKKEIFQNTLALPQTFQLDNYRNAIKYLKMPEPFINSLIIILLSITLIVLCTSMCAYALERVKCRTSTVLYMAFVSLLIVPFQTVMIPLIALFGKMHMLNRIGLSFMYLGFGSIMAIFLYHGSLKSVPRSLDEAATIDGCGPFKRFWAIIFPNLKIATVTVIILNSISIWNDYLLPSLVVNKKGMRTIPIMIYLFFGQYSKEWHYAMAALTISILPVIILYFFLQKQIIAGMVAGAVKE